ncbi:MAG: SDR family oxidoreductase [Pirellulales bacterium]
MTTNPQAIQRFDLSGKVAWVLGGAGLLGTEVCRALAEHGARVIVSDLCEDRAAALVAELRGSDLAADARKVDIGNEAQVIDATADIHAKYGRLDVMVNMTYFYTKKPWDELTAADFNAGMRVSLTGAFVATREAGKVMRRQSGGSIVHFSSMYGVVSPDPRMYPATQAVNPIDYGMAKAGILQMVRYQAVQLASSGVRVNAVVPGPFPIPSTQGQDTEFIKRLQAKVPMGRVGNPKEIAGAVVFLASDAASYVTGAQITVDGGWTAW